MKSIWIDEFPQSKESKNPLRFFLFVSRPHWRVATFAITAVVCGSVLSFSVPYIFKLITNAAFSVPQKGTHDLLVVALVYVGVTTLRGLMWRASGYYGSFWATGVRATARQILTSYITLHSRSYFSDRFGGSLANKIGHAANGVRGLVEKVLWQFFEFFIGIIVSLILLMTVNTTIAFIFLIWVFFAIAFNIYRARKRIPYSSATQKVETAMTGSTVDLLSNISAMQEYARRSFEIERIKESILKRRTTGLRNWHFGEITLTLNGLMQGLFAGAMVLLMVALVSQGSVSPGDIVLIVALIYRIEDQFIFLGSHINELSEQWGEIQESLDEIMLPHEIVDAPHAKKLIVTKGEIMFDAMRFAYAESVVFPGLSISIRGGERIGIVGRSGAGKSTFVRLLMRHYDVSDGAIFIDGQDIAKVTQDSLHRAMAIVPQESILFHRTIAENIAYGKPEATVEEIHEAARRAQAHDFIERLPEKYASMVGERGVKLSGGERQRIAIARAILKDAPVLILDEATASLDSESEVMIQSALHTLMEKKTVIAIAHRLSTLREMDRIIVLDRGEIVEEGTHEALIANGGIYSELWNHQAGGFLKDEDE
jgi:ABC-type multidrug transport system fused ATPase/permease subunit